MGKIVISANATLDGVVEDPDGQEGFAMGGWFHQFVERKDLEDWVTHETEEVQGAAALLYGRRTFEWFASRAPEMAVRVSPTWADRVNRLPKYVVSATLDHPRWGNPTVLAGAPAQAIGELKRKVTGEILVYGSYRLARTLIEQGLADELRLIVFPAVLGAGRRLFDETADKKPLHLVATRRIGDALVSHTYAFA